MERENTRGAEKGMKTEDVKKRRKKSDLVAEAEYSED